MVRNKEYRQIGEHKEKIGKVTFVVNSFADQSAEKTSEQLVMQMLEVKVIMLENQRFSNGEFCAFQTAV